MKGMWYLILSAGACQWKRWLASLTNCSIFGPVSEFKTKTPDPSKHAWSYSTRSVDHENWAKLIACRVIDPGDDGQNFQSSYPT
ncbi:hypothetical protein M1N21_00540, partial [Dehalococcoidia bacterium]|nr:hypothetical protein [Dehalococcoidia bacterium]